MAIMSDPVWVDSFRRMWFRGKRGWTIARLMRRLRLDATNVLTRELADMTIDTCPVKAWNGEAISTKSVLSGMPRVSL